MKRKAAALMLLAGLAGGANAGKFMATQWNASPEGPSNGVRHYATAPNYVGPHGQPVFAVTNGSPSNLSAGEEAARAHLNKQFPPALLQQTGYYAGPGSGGG
ncbi:MAG: hypothetical protein ACRC33_16885, partial [Gemmataceae bacterium]